MIEPVFDPKTKAFYVDVGDMKPEEALAYLQRVREEYEKMKSAPTSTDQ
jgi:hypothetical protein